MNPTTPQPQGNTPQPVPAPAPAAPAAPKVAATAGQQAPAISNQSSVISKPAAAAAPPPPSPVLPNPLAHLSLPFHGVDYAAKGYHVEATVAPDQVVFAAQQLDKEGLSLDRSEERRVGK